jgi:uncharacterized protein
MAEAIFWGAILRIVQAALQAAPFIFTGLVITGILHRMLGQAHTRTVFGSNSLSSLLQSWVLGMLLPGCSLGVIPIVKQLRRSAISVGTIFAFALSSPLFDPLSMLYGLTLSKPETILAFALCSLLVVTVSGSLFDHWFPNSEVVVPEPTPTPPGLRRLLATLVVMARESVSDSMLLIGCGLACVGLLSTVLPPGVLMHSMSHQNPYSPLLMTVIALPAYATPMTAMGQLGSMFQHGNSIGAAFILLIFGAGMNCGLLVWMLRHYGLKQCAIWIGLMLAVVVTLSYGIERPLYPTDVEPADHTHAFDIYCQPFAAVPPEGYVADIWRRVRLDTQLHEIVGAVLVGCLVLGGLGLKWLDRRWVIETWLNKPAAVSLKPRSKWDVNVPGPVLAGVAFLAILCGSVVGCFAYYPTPDETIAELGIAKTEALAGALTGDRRHALHWIPICEGWTRRLQVGMYLRRWELSEYHRMKARVFLNRLELLEHLLEDDASIDEVRHHVAQTSATFTRLSKAFTKE